MAANVLAAKRNVKKKTDDLLKVWFPPLPNKDKVEVIISLHGDYIFYYDRYTTLDIAANIGDSYLNYMYINGNKVVATPKLYLDDNINGVYIHYISGDLSKIFYWRVLISNGTTSFIDYLPQVGHIGLEIDKYSFPRGYEYEGIRIGKDLIWQSVFAYPVDLFKEDFEIWRNGIKYTVRLNLDNTQKIGEFTWAYFTIVKAEFYGELLPSEWKGDFIELKPKGD